MRKTTIAIIMLLSVTAVFGQEKKDTATIEIDNARDVYIGDNEGLVVKCDTVYIRDTIRIKDTVNVPIYLVDVTDTLPATVMYKKDSKSARVYTLKGFALVRGFKVMVNGKPQWADKPQVVGALDDKRKPLKHVIQVL